MPARNPQLRNTIFTCNFNVRELAQGWDLLLPANVVGGVLARADVSEQVAGAVAGFGKLHFDRLASQVLRRETLVAQELLIALGSKANRFQLLYIQIRKLAADHKEAQRVPQSNGPVLLPSKVISEGGSLCVRTRTASRVFRHLDLDRRAELIISIEYCRRISQRKR